MEHRIEINYYPEDDSIYINFACGVDSDSSIEKQSGTFVDLDADGIAVGLETYNVSTVLPPTLLELLKSFPKGKLIVTSDD